MNPKTRKRIGTILSWLGVGLMVLFGFVIKYYSSESAIHRFVQKSVSTMENREATGCFVFMHDTLLSWNDNTINPRQMKRKVKPGNDTICHLNNGYYFVRSHQEDSLSVYEFNLLSTDYPLNNPYCDNYNPVLPQFIDASLSFHKDNTGMPILNREGKTLAYLTVDTPPVLQRKYYYLFLLPFAISLLGILLLLRKPKDNQKKYQSGKLEKGILVILLLSIVFTYIYSIIVTSNENKHIRNMAESLVQKRDTSFEASYFNFEETVKTDSSFCTMVFGESNVLADVLLDYCKELLFDENMNAYTVTLTLCAQDDCDNYFIDKLGNNKNVQLGEGLCFMDYYTLDPNYLSKIEVLSADTLSRKTLYFEFYKPVAPEGFSYDYSVANYRDGMLVYKYGRYVYPNFISSLEHQFDDFSYSKHYKHYSVYHSDNDLLVISVVRKSFLEKTASFALFFLGMLLPYLLVMWLRYSKKFRRWRDCSLSQRLQTVILLTLGISFVVLGPVSVIYMRSLYNKNKANYQFETTLTLSNEMRNSLDFESLLQIASRDRWNELLQRYANTFFTDINLYQLDGQLLATTRPEIFELNLQAPLMNAEAYHNLHYNFELYFNHQERIGNVVYESSYLPLTDAKGNTLAYLNTPFFSSSIDLQKEIKSFVLTYLNLILVFLGIALIVVLQLTKRLTQPLALIQKKLGVLKFDQKNEPIEYKGNDEIGALVEQYNQLIVKLKESAAELRRTATESAWRGVARQVAHEIKNSLTPMRLSVQMLQRVSQQQGGEMDERIQRTTRTLLEQIDTLSDISSSFSSYAKLPENHPQPLDLAELVENVVNLYDNVENITFQYDADPHVDYMMKGDKTNLNSAVGNLIKNAVQAIGDKPDGQIEVKLKADDTHFIISVKDNGKGIKEEDKKMIFLPNFTTKSGGSGVGLSLTYNIVTSTGGTITFNSKEGEGTEFVITLPKQ